MQLQDMTQTELTDLIKARRELERRLSKALEELEEAHNQMLGTDQEFELLNRLCEYVNTFGGNPIEYLQDRCREYSLELKA